MKKHVLLWMLLGISTFSFGQIKTIKGIVTDVLDTPLAGATILIKNTNKGTTTDFDGGFSIAAAPTDSLVISYVGFSELEVLVGTQTNLTVQLQEDLSVLDEVVVVGYGTTTKKALTTAVSVVKGKDVVEDKPFTNIETALQGKVSGIQVVTPSGSPGQSASIRIRGVISLSGSSDPLYVIDGVQVANTEALNPRDVESVSILKDASAAAIYGAQAANGVVIITTKRGSGKSKVNFSAYAGQNVVANTLDVLNAVQYITSVNTARANAGLPPISDPNNFQSNSDFQNELYAPALTQNYDLSISGGDDKGRFYISGAIQDEEGTIETTGFKRYSLRFNQDRKLLNDAFKISSSVALSRTNFNVINDNQRVNQGGVVLSALQTPPNVAVVNADGTFPSNPFQPGFDNPIALVRGEDREFVTNKVLANLTGTYTLPFGLIAKSSLGIDHSESKFSRFVDPFSTSNGRANEGIAEAGTFLNTSFLWESTLDYTLTPIKEKLDINFLLGGAIQQREGNDRSIVGASLPGDAIRTIDPATDILSTSERVNENRTNSLFLRTKISYLDRYFLESTVRRDGSSRFGASNRFGYFPSVSGSWVVSEEQFMENIDWLSIFKIRYGYGFTGNQNIGDNRFQGLFSANANFTINGEVRNGIFPSQVANAALKWESTEQHNLGLDLSFLKNRINFNFEAYQKNTTDLLIDNPLPITTGFSNATQNIGSVRNKGIELALNAVVLDTEAMTWSIGGNFTTNANEVTAINGRIITSGFVNDQGDVTRTEEGQPVGNFFGFIADGVDPQTGDVIFRDLNDDGIIDDDNDRTIIGNALPDYTWAATSNFSYKGLELTLFFQGVQGQEIYNASRLELENQSGFTNQSTTVLNAWTPTNTITNIPRAVFGDPAGNNRASSRWVEDGSFIKLREVSLGYNLPKLWIEKLGISQFKVYVQGRNLATWTDYTGYDPEVSRDGANALSGGIDYGTYPQVRTFIGGLNVTF